MGGWVVKRDIQGTFTLYDAGLFFVFLMIASSLVTVYAFRTSRTVDERLSNAEYCEDARKAFLSATIPRTRYDHNGEEVFRKDMSVRALLLEQVYLENRGIARENFSYVEDIRRLGNEQFEELWGIVVDGQDPDELVFCSRGIRSDRGSLKDHLGEDVITSSWREDGLGGREVEIIFYYSY